MNEIATFFLRFTVSDYEARADGKVRRLGGRREEILTFTTINLPLRRAQSRTDFAGNPLLTEV